LGNSGGSLGNWQKEEGEESSVLLTIGSIGIDQTAAQPWQQFQQRYRNRALQSI
jgi:hypothetical protein